MTKKVVKPNKDYSVEKKEKKASPQDDKYGITLYFGSKGSIYVNSRGRDIFKGLGQWVTFFTEGIYKYLEVTTVRKEMAFPINIVGEDSEARIPEASVILKGLGFTDLRKGFQHKFALVHVKNDPHTFRIYHLWSSKINDDDEE